MLQSASRGGVCPRGECLLPGGCLVLGGFCSGGWVSQHAQRQTPLPPVDRQTPVKILPWPNFVAAGKYWPVLAKRSSKAPQTNTQQLLTYTLQQAVVSRLILIAFNVTSRSFGTSIRVPTRPGKPGKMRVHLENLEISWNFEKFNKYHGKMS